MNRFRRNQKGFTMIELMVVVVIVGILAAIAIPIYGKYVKQARTTEATGRMGELITAAKAWAQPPQARWPLVNKSFFSTLSSSSAFAFIITNPSLLLVPSSTLKILSPPVLSQPFPPYTAGRPAIYCGPPDRQ